PQELVSVEVTPTESCRTRGDVGDNVGGPTPPDTFCIIVPDGTHACQPDEGSPLFCEERGIWFLAGTASMGGCAKGGPPIFTAAPHYERWIAGITREAYFAETPPDPHEEELTEYSGVQEPPKTTENPKTQGEPKPTEDPGIREPPKTTREP
ncbi:POLS2 protein, partial [Chunga burmeisteri]|nr:POLS2 protein [Chunga burmeisteri]